MSTTEQSPMTEKENVRWRVANAHVDPDNYVFIPAKKQADYYDNDIPQRVAIYVRVHHCNILAKFALIFGSSGSRQHAKFRLNSRKIDSKTCIFTCNSYALTMHHGTLER